MPTIVPDPINAATPPDNEYVLNIPTEIRALKARVNAAAGLTSDSINYFRKNLLDNGTFQVHQRMSNLTYAASFAFVAGTKYFIADRWPFIFANNFTATLSGARETTPYSTTKLSYSVYTATATTNTRITMYQRIITARRYQNESLTLTVHLDVPAAVLAAGVFQIYALYNYGTGGTPTTQATLLNATITNSGRQLLSFTFDTPTPASQAEFGTDQNDYIQIQFEYAFLDNQQVKWYNAQLEVGGASPFEDLSYEEELARCMVHFQTSYSKGTRIGQATYVGSMRFVSRGTGTSPDSQVQFYTPMWTAPTVTLYSTGNNNVSGAVYKETATAGDVASSVADRISTKGFGAITLGSAAIDAHYYSYHWIADAEIY